MLWGYFLVGACSPCPSPQLAAAGRCLCALACLAGVQQPLHLHRARLGLRPLPLGMHAPTEELPTLQDPVSWTLYSLVVSNIGKEDDSEISLYSGATQSVPAFLKQTFRYRRARCRTRLGPCRLGASN